MAGTEQSAGSEWLNTCALLRIAAPLAVVWTGSTTRGPTTREDSSAGQVGGQLDQRRDGHPGPAAGHVAVGRTVVERRPRDVEVHPPVVADELLQERRCVHISAVRDDVVRHQIRDLA